MKGVASELESEDLIAYRLRVLGLSEVKEEGFSNAIPPLGLVDSPPGASKAAIFWRRGDSAANALEHSLEKNGTVVEAWSYRGCPVCFERTDNAVFLSSLAALPDEEWIYTPALLPTLKNLGISFSEILSIVLEAVKVLDGTIVEKKSELDRILAVEAERFLPGKLRQSWHGRSVYDMAGMQTTGEAVVSFLLRPASLLGKVVFAGRRGRNPLFTSYVGMYGQEADRANGDEFARRYFSVCGASDIDEFTRFSGLSRKSAQRMIDMLSDELVPVMLMGRRKLAIASLLPEIVQSGSIGHILVLSGHDPYLDLGERFLTAPEKSTWGKIWRTVSNPGVVLRDGKICALWRARKSGRRLSVSISPLCSDLGREKSAILEKLESYSTFLGCSSLAIETE